MKSLQIITNCDPEDRNIARQAYAGLLWSKQFYHYVIKDWLEGDRDQPPPPEDRKHGRNKEWGHLFNRDVISMPDKWEYPWVCINPGFMLGGHSFKIYARIEL